MWFSSTLYKALIPSLTRFVALIIVVSPQTGYQGAQAPSRKPLTVPQIAQKVLPSVVYIAMQDSGGKPVCYGSGFFVSNNYILTNKHVISCSSTTRGRVNIAGGRQSFTISTMVSWPDLDLALIEAEGLTAPPLQLATARQLKLRVGDDIFVAGNPEGLEGTFTRGIVSSVRSSAGLLQIDAPVSPGSSGGPVVDTQGRVAGITLSSIKEGQNLNFAIPASSLMTPLARMRRLMAQLKQKHAGGGVTIAETHDSVSRPSSILPANPTRRAWEARPDWGAFISPVVGDITIKDELKALLDSGHSPNTRDKNGRTSLHLAAMLGQAELARYLISRGADVNFKDGRGRTPLMLAASLDAIKTSANYSLWERLWTDLPCEGAKADSPFRAATDDLLAWHLRAQAQEPVVQLLLNAGADANLTDDTGLSALDYAAASGPAVLDRVILRNGKVQKISTASCELKLEQSPMLRGFRLGMSLREVLEHFEGFDLPPVDPCGRLTLHFNATYGTLREYALRPQEFDGVSQIKLVFVDNRLAFVQVFYDSFPWKSMDEYLAQLSLSLKLPGKWRTAAGGGNWVKAQVIGCDGFKVIAGRPSAPFVEMHDTATLQVLLERGVESQTRRRREAEQERERRRQTFKP